MADRVVRVSSSLVRVLAVGNIAFGVAFLGALMASSIWSAPLLARLDRKYDPAVALDAMTGIRLTLLIAIGVALAMFVLFRALLRILRTLGRGEPFALANAARVRTIGWALLALQLLDLGYGALTFWMRRHGVEVLDWTPSLTGWLSVLVAFVLARVFTEGAAMRDDLAGTV